MSTVQPTRAPLLLEKLSSEELLEMYCRTKEEPPFLILWERLNDKNDPESIYSHLRRYSRVICPPGSSPDWILYGSIGRAYKRFQRSCCKWRGRLHTEQFGYLKRVVAKCSVIDEYRWVRTHDEEEGYDQLGDFDFVDDAGKILSTARKEDIELWERLDRARHEDEERLLTEEEKEMRDVEHE